MRLRVTSGYNIGREGKVLWQGTQTFPETALTIEPYSQDTVRIPIKREGTAYLIQDEEGKEFWAKDTEVIEIDEVC